MKFAIMLNSSNYTTSAYRCLQFCKAILATENEIVRLFFYQDGVYNSSKKPSLSQKENSLQEEWKVFLTESRLDNVVCISSALKRGVIKRTDDISLNSQGTRFTLEKPWVLSGLGQLHDAIQVSDRLICFGGD